MAAIINWLIGLLNWLRSFFIQEPPEPEEPIWKWYREGGAPTPIYEVKIRDGNKLGVAMENKAGEVFNNNQAYSLNLS